MQYLNRLDDTRLPWDNFNPRLEDLQPLYQAVSHACQAGLQQNEAIRLHSVRILRKNENYTLTKLGAYGSELQALACYFDLYWTRIAPSIVKENRAWIFNSAGFCLRALGRLIEAREPMRIGLEMAVEVMDWRQASRRAHNLGELELTLGDVASATEIFAKSVTYADQSDHIFQRRCNRVGHADALHQAGGHEESLLLFLEAEEMQKKDQPEYALLYSLLGFRYCDLLLTGIEYSVWHNILRKTEIEFLADNSHHSSNELATCRAVAERAAQTLKWDKPFGRLMDDGLNLLTLSRTMLYSTVLRGNEGLVPHQNYPEQMDAAATLESAVSSFRQAGDITRVPLSLLTRALWRFLTGKRVGFASAQEDLDEAWEIAEPGPMQLHMIDVHLCRARLFFREEKYPWVSAMHDLAEARKLIERCGYWRRKKELEDAEDVVLGNVSS